MTDHEPANLNEMRMSDLVASLTNTIVRFAVSGAVHSLTTFLILSCTAFTPSRKAALIVVPFGHLFFFSSAAFPVPEPGLSFGSHVKHHFAPSSTSSGMMTLLCSLE